MMRMRRMNWFGSYIVLSFFLFGDLVHAQTPSRSPSRVPSSAPTPTFAAPTQPPPRATPTPTFSATTQPPGDATPTPTFAAPRQPPRDATPAPTFSAPTQPPSRSSPSPTFMPPSPSAAPPPSDLKMQAPDLTPSFRAPVPLQTTEKVWECSKDQLIFKADGIECKAKEREATQRIELATRMNINVSSQISIIQPNDKIQELIINGGNLLNGHGAFLFQLTNLKTLTLRNVAVPSSFELVLPTTITKVSLHGIKSLKDLTISEKQNGKFPSSLKELEVGKETKFGIIPSCLIPANGIGEEVALSIFFEEDVVFNSLEEYEAFVGRTWTRTNSDEQCWYKAGPCVSQQSQQPDRRLVEVLQSSLDRVLLVANSSIVAAAEKIQEEDFSSCSNPSSTIANFCYLMNTNQKETKREKNRTLVASLVVLFTVSFVAMVGFFIYKRFISMNERMKRREDQGGERGADTPTTGGLYASPTTSLASLMAAEAASGRTTGTAPVAAQSLVPHLKTGSVTQMQIDASSWKCLEPFLLDPKLLSFTKALSGHPERKRRLWLGTYTLHQQVVICRVEGRSEEREEEETALSSPPSSSKALLDQTLALVQQKMNHPNLTNLIGIIWQGNFAWDFCSLSNFFSKGNLNTWLATDDSSSSLRVSKRLRICMEIAQAVAFVHETKFHVRKLTSRSILLQEEAKSKRFTCKLNVFECFPKEMETQTLDELSQSIGLSFGKGELAWIAPEILQKKKEIDIQKANIYSLGVLFGQVLTSEVPYASLVKAKGTTLAELTIFQQLRAASTNLKPYENCSGWKKVPKELQELVKKCLALNPTTRPPAQDIVQQLTSISKLTDRKG